MTPTVEVATGRLQGLSARAGRSKRTVRAFHGIPYAADPVGPLRFRAPQPPEPWGGVRDATEFGPASMQSGASPFSGTIPGNHVAAVSERCLTLDVWAPDEAGGLPVLVWVSGGAFLTGGTGIETYDGSGLAADEGVVVVEVNYRLGVLGFGWFGGLGRDGGGAVESWAGDTNCGLRDQLAALSWVRDNIAAFGGDPTNVTVFGESAGAGSLAHLLASPASAGLARRCILQSPGIDHTLYPDDVERVADAVLRRLSIPRSKTELLWDVGAEDLVAAQEAVVLEMMTVLTSMPFHPFVDGDLVPSSPSTAMAGGAGAADGPPGELDDRRDAALPQPGRRRGGPRWLGPMGPAVPRRAIGIGPGPGAGPAPGRFLPRPARRPGTHQRIGPLGGPPDRRGDAAPRPPGRR